MQRIILSLAFTFILISLGYGQLRINEASNKNYKTVVDELGESNDWIEIYNNSSSSVDLNEWYLSDTKQNFQKWNIGEGLLQPNSFLLVHASGRDVRFESESFMWRSLVLASDTFRYIIPDREISNDWRIEGFNDTGWLKGKGGFGYGDDDDVTTVANGTTVLFLRRMFEVSSIYDVEALSLFMDFDDGFVAFLNGVEIARSNVSEINWNSTASGNREATMYNGGLPEKFEIDKDDFKNILVDGENVLAIQAYNLGEGSSDFSILPFLMIGVNSGESFYANTPSWFSVNAANAIHTNFKISGSGEEIYLSKGDQVIDSMVVDKLQLNYSRGRLDDGQDSLVYFVEPTPGSSNNKVQAYQEYAKKPEFSHEAGFYDGNIQVAIQANEEGGVMVYTTDGSVPTSSSTVYNAPLTVHATQTIRAAALVDGKMPSKIVTATYFIDEEFELPVLSVSSNNEEIFGPQGIFTNYNDTWDIPSYVEYFDKSGTLAFNEFAGMQVDGGAGGSRSHQQHSFRIEPDNGTFGSGDLNYKLLKRRPYRESYASFYVRNGSNQYNILPYKDGLQVNALGRNTYTYFSAYEPAAVFINGNFFGIYELREKINEDFLTSNYGMDTDSLDLLGVSYFKNTQGGDPLKANVGSPEPYWADLETFRAMSYSSSDYLSKVSEMLDIESYTDYIIAESWVGNNDWPFNNIKLFRCVGTDFKWRWAINDLEWALEPNGWTSSSFDHISYMRSQGSGNDYTVWWYQMMRNADYKAYFVNRFADLMNTSYRFAEIGNLEHEMYEELYSEMDRQFERWGGNVSSNMKTFEASHEIFRSELQKRTGYVRDDLQKHYSLKRQVKVVLDVSPAEAGAITISTITPNVYPWTGVYFGTVNVNVTAQANLGYRFSHWESDDFIGDETDAQQLGKFNNDQAILKAVFVEDHIENGGVVVSEINYKQGAEMKYPDWLEFCNLSNEDVNLKGWFFTDNENGVGHSFTFGTDKILMSNERLVLTNNLASFTQMYPDVNVYNAEFIFGLGTPSDEVNLYKPDSSLVFTVKYSDQYPWPLSGNYEGRTLELRGSNGDFDASTTWFKGCVGGSPGEAFVACDEVFVSSEQLVVLESNLSVFPNPVADYMQIEVQLTNSEQLVGVQFFSFTGELVWEVNLFDETSNKQSVDLSMLAKGMYIIEVQTSKRKLTQKIMKN